MKTVYLLGFFIFTVTALASDLGRDGEAFDPLQFTSTTSAGYGGEPYGPSLYTTATLTLFSNDQYYDHGDVDYIIDSGFGTFTINGVSLTAYNMRGHIYANLPLLKNLPSFDFAVDYYDPVQGITVTHVSEGEDFVNYFQSLLGEGFSDYRSRSDYVLSGPFAQTPEPGSAGLILTGAVMAGGGLAFRRRLSFGRRFRWRKQI